MFRLRIDAILIGEVLTAVWAPLLVAEILDRITLPRRDETVEARSPRSPWRGFGVDGESRDRAPNEQEGWLHREGSFSA
jgi:hypothetical protein